MIRIWVDFQALDGGRVPLAFLGSYADVRKQNAELREGLHIIVYNEEFQSEAIVEKGEWIWYGRLVGPFTEIPKDERRDPDPDYFPLVSKGDTIIRIWAEFNELDKNLVPLDSKKGLADIRRQNVELQQGLLIVVYEYSIQAEAIVEKLRERWYGRLVGPVIKIPENERRPQAVD